MNNTFYQDEIIRFNNLLYGDQFHLKILIRTKRYLDKNFINKIELNALALSQGFSKYHLLRLFKFYFGVTPRQYQIKKRIEKSKENLKNGMKVSHSCYSVGFTSVTTFSALFKRKTGLTPKEFQKSKIE
tara:strand:- start:383 stop:769 length:387 start_codon:yes stop_codon:yes gene_type:complete